MSIDCQFSPFAVQFFQDSFFLLSDLNLALGFEFICTFGWKNDIELGLYWIQLNSIERAKIAVDKIVLYD